MLRKSVLASVVVVLLLLMLAPTVLASGYVYEKSFGRYGTSLGELRFPMGISADGKGALYIADLNNSKIQKFTTDGVFIGSVGSYGSALGELNYPYQTLVDSTGSLLVGENGASRVQVFSLGLTPLVTWGTVGSGPAQFTDLHAMTMDADGALYVGDFGGRIQKFSSTFTYLTEWTAPSCTGLAVDEDGLVYASNWMHGTVSVHSPSGALLRTIGSPGHAPGQLISPTNLAFAPDGSLLVGEGWIGVGRVSRFDPQTGEFLEVATGPEGGKGDPSYPYGLTVDKNGDLFVADALDNDVKKYRWDATPPAITHDYDGEWHSQPVTVQFDANDAVAGVAAVHVSVDGGDWQEADHVDVPAPADHTNDGIHYVRYRAVDTVDNWTATKLVKVKIDTRKPRTVVSGVPLGWAKSDVWLTFTATDVGSGVGGVHYRIGTPWWLDLPEDGVVGLAGEGVHLVEYYAWDNAEPLNIEAQKSVTVRIDKTKPAAVATNAITVVRGGTATFKYTLADNLSPTCNAKLVIKRNTTAVKTVLLGAKVTKPMPTAYSKKLTISLPAGVYTWAIVANDLAGNKVTSLAKKLTVK